MKIADIEILLDKTAQAVPEETTAQVVSEVFNIYDNRYLLIDIVASDVTDTTGITAVFQDKSGTGSTWTTKKSVAIEANGQVSISLMPEVAGDQTYLPLRKQGRVVITTGADDEVTIDSIVVTLNQGA